MSCSHFLLSPRKWPRWSHEQEHVEGINGWCKQNIDVEWSSAFYFMGILYYESNTNSCHSFFPSIWGWGSGATKVSVYLARLALTSKIVDSTMLRPPMRLEKDNHNEGWRPFRNNISKKKSILEMKVFGWSVVIHLKIKYIMRLHGIS